MADDRVMRRSLLVAALLVIAPSARADVIPSCPPGQHAQMNPVPAGSMHHAGGSCVPDEPAPPEPAREEPPPEQPEAAHSQPAEAEQPASSGGCSAAAGSSSTAFLLASLGVAALVLRRRR